MTIYKRGQMKLPWLPLLWAWSWFEINLSPSFVNTALNLEPMSKSILYIKRKQSQYQLPLHLHGCLKMYKHFMEVKFIQTAISLLHTWFVLENLLLHSNLYKTFSLCPNFEFSLGMSYGYTYNIPCIEHSFLQWVATTYFFRI